MNKKEIIKAIRDGRYQDVLETVGDYLAEQPGVKKPEDLYDRLAVYGTKKQEYFIVVTLDGAHKIINTHVVSKGLVNRTLVHPREVFRVAIIDHATSIIVAHNHPSGNIDPSAEDIDTTRRLKDSGELLGISVLDHIVIGRTKQLSFKELGYMR